MTKIYKKDITRKHKLLTNQEQVDLYKKMKEGDKEAKEALIYSCLPLVIDIANKFRINNKHIDLEDMIQEGNIALINAVEKWDANKANITTVATWYVRNTLVDMITDAKYNIKQPYSLSRRAAEELRRIHKIDSNDINYISEETGLSVKRVAKLLRAVPRNTKRRTYQSRTNVLSQISHNDEEDTLPTKPCMADLVNLINNNLTGDQKNIFCLWAGIDSKKIGPKEIARSLGETEKYVYDNIYGAKRILSKAAKEVSHHA
tara:strand:+ start:102 stop:881 length:780 start_codon:yes stop_codon:yes gene_type:complete